MSVAEGGRLQQSRRAAARGVDDDLASAEPSATVLAEGGLKVGVQQLAGLLAPFMALVFVSTLEPGDGLVHL